MEGGNRIKVSHRCSERRVGPGAGQTSWGSRRLSHNTWSGLGDCEERAYVPCWGTDPSMASDSSPVPLVYTPHKEWGRSMCGGYSGCSFQLVRLLCKHPRTIRDSHGVDYSISKQEPLNADLPPSNMVGRQPRPRRTEWRRTSRTCQTMELDEGPPDHARSTWKKGTLFEGTTSPM